MFAPFMLPFRKNTETKKESEDAAQAGARELADLARGNGEEIREKLRGIRYVCSSGRIPQEKLEDYRTIVMRLADILAASPTLVLDTAVMDDCLKQLTELLQNAITNGYPNTVKEICALLKLGITELRRPVSGTDTLETQWELEQRNARLTQEVGLMKYMLQLEKTEAEISDLDCQIAHGKERYQEAYRLFKEIVDERADVVRALDRIAVEKPPREISGDVMILQARKQNVVSIYNGINQAKSIKGVKEARRSAYLMSIETMRNEIRLTQNRLNPALIALQEQMQRDIDAALVEEKKENERLRSIASEFDASLEAYFSDPQLVNEMIETDMEFQKLMETERQAEEGRRLAQEERLRRQVSRANEANSQLAQ